MAIIADDRFQGMCLWSQSGADHMRRCFDTFPPYARERLRNSPFNICAACVSDAIRGMERGIESGPSDYETVISGFEDQIRRETENNKAA